MSVARFELATWADVWLVRDTHSHKFSRTQHGRMEDVVDAVERFNADWGLFDLCLELERRGRAGKVWFDLPGDAVRSGAGR